MIFLYLFSMHKHVHTYACHGTCVDVKGQLVGIGSSFLWVPEIKRSLLGLAASTFNH